MARRMKQSTSPARAWWQGKLGGYDDPIKQLSTPKLGTDAICCVLASVSVSVQSRCSRGARRRAWPRYQRADSPPRVVACRLVAISDVAKAPAPRVPSELRETNAPINAPRTGA